MPSLKLFRLFVVIVFGIENLSFSIASASPDLARRYFPHSAFAQSSYEWNFAKAFARELDALAEPAIPEMASDSFVLRISWFSSYAGSATLRIEQPSPDEAGHDQRNRQRVKEDGSEEAFSMHLLVDQRRKDEADDDRQQAAEGKDHQILQGQQP